MHILSVLTGELYENCYIIYEGESNKAILVDPGDDALKIIDKLESKNLTASHIFLTHGHVDHIGAITQLKDKYNCEILIHEKDGDMLTEPMRNLSFYMGKPITTYPATATFKDKDTFSINGLEIKVLHTPGHSAGSSSFMINDNIFTGDTLFKQSIGRTDFPDSSFEDLDNSVKCVLGGLSGNYNIYAGHGPATTLDEEKKTNMFMR